MASWGNTCFPCQWHSLATSTSRAMSVPRQALASRHVHSCLRTLDLAPELKLGARNLMEYQSNSTIILIDEY